MAYHPKGIKLIHSIIGSIGVKRSTGYTRPHLRLIPATAHGLAGEITGKLSSHFIAAAVVWLSLRVTVVEQTSWRVFPKSIVNSFI